MKRFFLVLLVITFIPVTKAHAQIAVIDAAVTSAIAGTAIEQGIYWAQQAMDMVEQIYRMKEMIERLGKQIEMQMENLANISDIHSYKDFTEWHNRQLYLERMTEETWDSMSIKIGKKDYKLTDIEGMAYGFKDANIDYWNKEFTEEQRQEMYIGLGLTPSNYAYIKTWEERDKMIAQAFLTAPNIHNTNYMHEMNRNNENMNALEKDKRKKADDPTRMGEKGVAVINAETNIASNKVLNDIEGHLSDIKEKIAVDTYQKRTPTRRPSMTKWDRENGIQPLK